MKYEMIFATAVLGIAAIHLLFNVVHFLTRFKSTQAQENSSAERQNWYVFFDTSTLYGKPDSADISSDSTNKDIPESDPAIEDFHTQEIYG